MKNATRRVYAHGASACDAKNPNPTTAPVAVTKRQARGKSHIFPSMIDKRLLCVFFLFKTSHLLSSSRDYSSSDGRPSSWRLPSSLTSSSRSYDRPWADSSLSSRTKLVPKLDSVFLNYYSPCPRNVNVCVCVLMSCQSDSEGSLGSHSGLLNATDDGDSKRVKLSYSTRGLYSRTPSTSVTGSSHPSHGLSAGRGTESC